jgi:hypothetical protein
VVYRTINRLLYTPNDLKGVCCVESESGKECYDVSKKVGGTIRGDAIEFGDFLGDRLSSDFKHKEEPMVARKDDDWTHDKPLTEMMKGSIKMHLLTTPMAGNATSEIVLHCNESKHRELKHKDGSAMMVAVKIMSPLEYLVSEYVPDMLNRFMLYIQKNVQKEGIITIAARTLMALNSIHPFHDSNGRSNRMFVDYLLKRFGGLHSPTCYNVNIAAFGKLDNQYQTSPTGATNELLRGLFNTYLMFDKDQTESLMRNFKHLV